MEIKTQPATPFVYARFEITRSQMTAQTSPVIPQLLQEILDHNMQLSGPVYWNYFGFAGDEASSF